MNKKISIIVILFFLASAVNAEVLTVNKAVETALKNNPEIQSAKAVWESAKAKIIQTLSLDDPKVGVAYEQIPSGSRNLEDGMKMYTFEQMIMFPGKIYAEWLMAKAEALGQEARYRAKVLEISSQVKSSYYDLFFAERGIETVAEIKELLAKIKKTAEAKYVVGNAVQADVLMANIEYLTMDNELTIKKQERMVKEAKLNSLLNWNDKTSIETEVVLNLAWTMESRPELEKLAVKNRPQLLEMKAELEAKDLAHLKAKLDYFPDIMLGIKKRVTDGWDAMISFSAPLYFWKQAYGISAAGLERESAEDLYANMKNMTIWEVKEAWTAADSARKTIGLYEEKIVPQSLQALKAALASYQTGKVDFQALMYVEKVYKEVKLKYYESQISYGKALAELERISGKELM